MICPGNCLISLSLWAENWYSYSLEPKNNTPVFNMNMNTELEVMSKAYQSDGNIRHALTTTLEEGIEYDRTLNREFTLKHFGYCNMLLLGHKEEKCRHSGGGYTN